MKIDYKSLSYALISAIIITQITGLILATTDTINVYPEYLEKYKDIDYEKISKYYDGNISTTIAEAESNIFPTYLPLWVWIVVSFLCIIALTIISYFFILYITKTKI